MTKKALAMSVEMEGNFVRVRKGHCIMELRWFSMECMDLSLLCPKAERL